MDYYKQIKDKILNNEAYERIKDYSKERHRVLTYFEIGRLLHEAGKHYGEGIIQKYADSLEKDFGKKYNKRTLFRMRQFYMLLSELKWASVSPKLQKVVSLTSQDQKTSPSNDSPSESAYLKEDFNQKVSPTLSQDRKVLTVNHVIQKVSTPANQSSNNPYFKGYLNQKVSTSDQSSQKTPTLKEDMLCNPSFMFNLTWSHYTEILFISDKNEALYYSELAIVNHLSVRELRDRIKSKEYYRLDEKTRNKLIKLEETTAIDYVKNPILIRNNNNYTDITEKILKNLILEDIKSFLKELGDGFSFIEEEYKIKIDDRYNYIDLFLYNIKYKCYVVIELKVTEFKSEYIGQILKYMNYIDKNLKTIEEDKTIGIIICKKNNHFYMEYCSDERVISREYKLIK